ncbi:Ribosomal RNA small subunit methyltransferase B [Minicystis rosea]|nr:Ribosomal RNA small subunit methyltransferase B [Minicystis rosea]
MNKIVGPQTISPARAAAVDVLCRVFEAGAFAAAALDAELRRDGLDPRDAGLATELVYGVLRTEAYLDDRIAELAARKAWSRDVRVRAHVLAAAYSITFLDRIPTFAAVSEAVAGVKADGGERVAGFANAVLRRLASEVEGKRPALADAVTASAPGWLRGALRRSLGRSGAMAYLAAGPVPPPIGLCVATGEDRAAWIDKLQAAAPNATIEAGQVSPRAILVRGAGDVRRLPGAGEAWIVQEEGAQVVALAAGASAGDRVLDACAGHGNKTWLLAGEVGSGGLVDAADLYAHKLDQLREGPPGKLVHQTFAIDWTATTGTVPDDYDRVIVDAPCSGVGTLRRRPEIARHREAEDLPRLAALQVSIARRAATCVKDGGRLVFAVCSVLREEGEEVVDQLATGEHEGVRLEPAPFDGTLAREIAGEGHMLRVLPHVQGTDGYFVASFIARRARG